MPVDIPDIASPLLDWYGRHARTLPWRSPPGLPPPEPYRVWLSEVMLQQTTVAAVIPYFVAFTSRWPDVQALAAASDADVMTAWAGLGYYSRARNLLACARTVVDQRGEHFPGDEAELRSLPGIGAYTAAAIAAIAYGQRAVVVDGNVERVIARLFAVEAPLPAAKPELRRLTDLVTPEGRCGDFAQAMMDLGATICTPRNPRCPLCPIATHCTALRSGDPAGYPRRMEKSAKPERRGIAIWVERDGHVLLVRRPPRGLLGGMLALPSAGWDGSEDDFTDAGASFATVTHVFTHFRLTLDLCRMSKNSSCLSQLAGEWWSLDELEKAGLPTLFAKAARTAMGSAAMEEADDVRRPA